MAAPEWNTHRAEHELTAAAPTPHALHTQWPRFCLSGWRMKAAARWLALEVVALAVLDG